MNYLTAAGLHVGLPKYYRSTRSLASYRSRESFQSRNSHVPQHDIKLQEKVVINVSGEVYETLQSTLNEYPETLLGTAEKRSSLLDKLRDEIFINRHRTAFEAILFYYQSSGNLVRPENVPMADFEEECLFYEISESAIKRMKDRECYLFKTKRIGAVSSCKWKCWTFLDFPKEFSNFSAVAFFLLSYLLILISLAVFCLETELLIIYKGIQVKKLLNILYRIEFTLNIYFAMEILIRFSVHPKRKKFLIKPINIVEFISVFTYLLLYGVPRHYLRHLFIEIARILRVLQIARLAKIVRCVKLAGEVFQSSINDILSLLFVTLIICVTCGSCMYYIEGKVKDTAFTSIPESMWWAIQSVLCLGYGDIVPTSHIGKALCAVVMFIGLVVTTILFLSLGGRMFDMYLKGLHQKEFLPEEEKVDYEIHYKQN